VTAGEGTTAGSGAVAAGLGLAAVGLGPGRSFPSGLALRVAAGLETPAGLSFPGELEAGLGDELVEGAEEVLPELEPPVEEDEVLVVAVGSVVAAGFGVGAGLGFGLGFGVVVVAAGVVSVGAGSGAGSSASARGAKAAASAAPARTAAARTRIALDAGRAPQLTASILPSSLSP